MSAFLKALGYTSPKPGSVSAGINSIMGSVRYHHPKVPGHSILAYHDKQSGKIKYMSTPADDHPKNKSTQSFDKPIDAVKHGAGHHLEKVSLKSKFKEETDLEEGRYTKTYRRKPTHRKMVRKRSVARSRRQLRMGDNVMSFKEFITESE